MISILLKLQDQFCGRIFEKQSIIVYFVKYQYFLGSALLASDIVAETLIYSLKENIKFWSEENCNKSI